MPETRIPTHVAIIMDGNGRWAKSRLMPRAAGHAAGAERVTDIVRAAASRGISFLTLFAFSSENWKRPPEEVSAIMALFSKVLRKETPELQKEGVRLKIAGDVSGFTPELQREIALAQEATKEGTRMVLNICANYGGRWDILQAAQKCAEAENFSPEAFEAALALAPAPEVDLMIRTGGESRISNFMLWQAAYAELYFTETLWPDFDANELDKALTWYAGRQRRFGLTSEQISRD